MSLMTVITVIIGIVLVYAAVKNVDPREVVKRALRQG